MRDDTIRFMKAVGPIESPAKDGDVGFNLPALEAVLIPWEGFKLVKTGIRVELPEDCWGLVIARSSCNFTGALINLTGVIDPGYRGELSCMIHNVKARPNERGIPVSEDGIWVHPGQSLGQLVVIPRVVPTLVRVDDLTESARGVSGFGSSGAGILNVGRL